MLWALAYRMPPLISISLLMARTAFFTAMQIWDMPYHPVINTIVAAFPYLP